ncbi:Cyclin-dependent kinases regulatory subunit (Cell division control protein cks1) [Linnemannia zychae]|nr:Cyclin-dependent kinases regulatory subunit (Cell division control protein cks1) [Linnemannia zychae]
MTREDEHHSHQSSQGANTRPSEFTVYQDPEEREKEQQELLLLQQQQQQQQQRYRSTSSRPLGAIQRGHQRIHQQQQQQVHPGDMSGIELYEGDERGPINRIKHSSSQQQLQQRRSSAQIELQERSRSASQQQYTSSSQDSQRSQQRQDASSTTVAPYGEVPGTPARKRTRDGDVEGLRAGDQRTRVGGGEGVSKMAIQDADILREQERRRRIKRQQLLREQQLQQQQQQQIQRSQSSGSQVHGQQAQQTSLLPTAEQQLQEKQRREAEVRKLRKIRAEEIRRYQRLVENIDYGQVYEDDTYEYRTVTLPKVMLRYIPRNFMAKPEDQNSFLLRLLKEEEWRHLGIKMSHYWVHFMCHAPEPHLLLFRRPVGTGKMLQEEQERKKAIAEAEASKKAIAEAEASKKAPANASTSTKVAPPPTNDATAAVARKHA